MNEKNDQIQGVSDTLVNTLTHTLLYEGYSLFPYHRSAIKNQKPVPFGVIYPEIYHAYNLLLPAEMQCQCIIAGRGHVGVRVTVCFLHLVKIPGVGWQTLERKIESDNLSLPELVYRSCEIPFQFEASEKGSDEILAISGQIIIKAQAIHVNDSFRISVGIINTSVIREINTISRDEALQQSFLSTHSILRTTDGVFISAQAPEPEYSEAIAECQNKGTWPVLVDENNTTMLCSPIIVYDHPRIHPQSRTDLFDSTEIEEALMLHFEAMSEEEKEQIAGSDEKLKAMLNKVKEITPQEIIKLHGFMYDDQEKIK